MVLDSTTASGAAAIPSPPPPPPPAGAAGRTSTATTRTESPRRSPRTNAPLVLSSTIQSSQPTTTTPASTPPPRDEEEDATAADALPLSNGDSGRSGSGGSGNGSGGGGVGLAAAAVDRQCFHSHHDRHYRHVSQNSEVSIEFDFNDPTAETPLAAHVLRKKSSAATATGPMRISRAVYRSQNNNNNISNDQQQQFHCKTRYGTIPESVSVTSLTSTESFRGRDDHDHDDDRDRDHDDDDDRSLSSRHSLLSLDGSIASIGTAATMVLENFREGLTIPFYDTAGRNVCWGLTCLAAVGAVLGLMFPKDPALRAGRWGSWYRWISSMIGYTYFTLWSVCFYPQVLQNYRNQSAAGVSADFAVLNFMGWSFYAIYLGCMYLDADIQEMYQERFQNEKSSVASNDVAFAFHAMILSCVYVIQIAYYGKGNTKHDKRKQDKTGRCSCCSWMSRFRLKTQTWFLVLGMGVPAAVVPVLITAGYLPYSVWLNYLYALSACKICCTMLKYTKQAVFNYQRKSTAGWNIWYNFLECSGGLLSMVQIVLDSADKKDLSGITGNMAKFVLGFATITFDAIFFMQHYVWYGSSSCGNGNTGTTTSSSQRDALARKGKIPSLIKTGSGSYEEL